MCMYKSTHKMFSLILILAVLLAMTACDGTANKPQNSPETSTTSGVVSYAPTTETESPAPTTEIPSAEPESEQTNGAPETIPASTESATPVSAPESTDTPAPEPTQSVTTTETPVASTPEPTQSPMPTPDVTVTPTPSPAPSTTPEQIPTPNPSPTTGGFLSKDVYDEIKPYAESLGYSSESHKNDANSWIMAFYIKSTMVTMSLYYGDDFWGGQGYEAWGYGSPENFQLYSIDEMKNVLKKYADIAKGVPNYAVSLGDIPLPTQITANGKPSNGDFSAANVYADIKAYAESLGYQRFGWSGALADSAGTYDSTMNVTNATGTHRVDIRFYYIGGGSAVAFVYNVIDPSSPLYGEVYATDHSWSCGIDDIKAVIKKYA